MTSFPRLPRLRVDDENMEKIHCGARRGQTEEVKRLVELGVDPAIPNRFGCTALHLACKFGQVEAAKYLASICDVHGAWHGQKPLHLAVLANKEELVEALVAGAKERGRNVEIMLNECDDSAMDEIGEHHIHTDGQTALHWCVALGEDYLSMLKLLIKLGASPTTKNKENVTSMMYAIRFGNEAAMEAMLAGVKTQQLRLDYQDKEGRTHLHYAILYNRQDYAMRFIEMGHDPQIEDDKHDTPLFLALRATMPELLTYLLQNVDQFSVQQAPFHNGSVVMPERIEWLSFATDEQARVECIRLFQKRLDEVSLRPEEAEKKKAKPTAKRMKLAPSAPIRSRSIGNSTAIRSRSIGNRNK
ncbi:ankyrin [Trypanosoma rangeli]|uniref:Ankyrin n=1 Tax=Trypanosoma rangeli TaxID=5698 RepID=A0A422MZY2_TRYRA|nr:ankyrin [Trypanosoma rangeli]RNE98769.1 ankyrin [Trypanosoma rangeli]|eukprot:RNE98769.1 ankyrin [Trypanosoma rangeli]